jgi:hypothetical protein
VSKPGSLDETQPPKSLEAPDSKLLAPSYHGAEGDRTPDLCSAIAALSQLSYSPNVASVSAKVASVPAMKDGKSTGCWQFGQPNFLALPIVRRPTG